MKDLHSFTFEGRVGSGSSKASRQPDPDVMRKLQGGDDGGPLFNYCMRFQYPDPAVHAEVFKLVSFAVPALVSANDAPECLSFWKRFVLDLFGATAVANDVDDAKTASTDAKTASGPGTDRMDTEDDANDATNGDNESKPRYGASNSKGLNGIFPVRLALETWAIEERVRPMRRHKRPSRLFFGSGATYVLLRLHELLYRRMARAQELAEAVRESPPPPVERAFGRSGRRGRGGRGGRGAPTPPVKTTNNDDDSDASGDIDDLFNGLTGNADGTGRAAGAAEKPYDTFWTLLRDFIGKKIDSAAYEEGSGASSVPMRTCCSTLTGSSHPL